MPVGTRNDVALDLGVDRDDVVRALDAFTEVGERIVDLAEVNGVVFVNEVGSDRTVAAGIDGGVATRSSAAIREVAHIAASGSR